MPSALHRSQYRILRSLLVCTREQAGLTQQDVARALGKPQSFVSKYERGERRLDVTEFVEVAFVLGVDPGELITAYRNRLEGANQLFGIGADGEVRQQSAGSRGRTRRR
ncbi:helix-turn-helix transcriptional regulator [Pseudothauera nasutitermitis]|uniref:Helix-turn-helix transcriptional regulator n=1 Tax=Pseudothauera nasutitermitis TaxID=2565930 RepID=A0A4S4AX89_9RHOO|nr:helix-turn-helix transcriptional regulator [Pseudothauera nasutitermitis]THF64695.1 helix-turn-helix transcriptional regulator [Pseudothauera nasutitermitis]